MTESQYHEMLDQLFIAIEQALDDCVVDIDYESAEGILTCILPNQSKIILNKQPPLLQLWVATKFNGHHFNFVDGLWIDERTDAEFFSFFDAALSKQADAEVVLNLKSYL